MGALQKKCKKFEASQNKFDAVTQSKAEEIKKLQNEMNLFQNNHNEIEKDFKNFKIKYGLLLIEKEKLIKNEVSRSEQDEIINTRMDELKKELDALKIKNRELMEQNEALIAENKKNKDVQTKYDELNAKYKTLANEYNELKQKHNALKKRNHEIVKGLEDRINVLQESENKSIGNALLQTMKDSKTRIKQNKMNERTKSMNLEWNGSKKEINEKLKVLQKKYDELKKSQNKIDESFHDFNKQHQDEMNALKLENTSLSQKVIKATTKTKEFEQQFIDCSDDLNFIKSKLKQSNCDNIKYQKNINEMQAKYNKLKQEFDEHTRIETTHFELRRKQSTHVLKSEGFKNQNQISETADDQNVKQRLKELQTKYDQMKKSQEQIDESLNDLNKQHQDKINDLKIQNEESMNKLNKQIKTLMIQNHALEQDQEVQNEEMDEMRNKYIAEKEETDSKIIELQTKCNEFVELQNEYDAYAQFKANEIEILQSLNDELIEQKNEFDDQSKALELKNECIVQKLNEQIISLQQQIKSLKNKTNFEENQIEEIVQELECTKQRSLSYVNLFKTQCKTVMNSLNTEKANLSQKYIDFGLKYDELLDENIKLKQEFDDQSKELQEQIIRLQQHPKMIESLQNELDLKDNEYEKIEQELKNDMIENQELVKNETSRSEQDKIIKIKMTELKKELNALKIQNNELNERYKNLGSKYYELQQKNNAMKKRNSGIVKGLKSQIIKLQSKSKQKEQQQIITSLKQKINQINQQWNNCKIKLEKAQNDLVATNILSDGFFNSQIKQNKMNKTRRKSMSDLECNQEQQNDKEDIVETLKNEISQISKKLDEERASKETIQRSKSEAESEVISKYNAQQKIINNLRDENEALNDKLNESKIKFEDLNKRIFELEDNLKASNVRNAVIYKQYKSANEQNLKWKEYGKAAKSEYDKLEKENLSKQQMIKSLETELKSAKEKNLNFVNLFKSQCKELNTDKANLSQKITDFEIKYDKLLSQNNKLKQELEVSNRFAMKEQHELNEKYKTLEMRKSSFDDESVNERLAELQQKNEKISSELKIKNKYNQQWKVKYECLMDVKNELIKQCENKFDIISDLKENINSLTSQIIDYQQQIKQIQQVQTEDQKKEIVNKLKMKIIETENAKDLIKKELVGLTKRIKIRLSVPQNTNFDGDLVDVLLSRQKKMIKEYKRKCDLTEKLNEQLVSEINH